MVCTRALIFPWTRNIFFCTRHLELVNRLFTWRPYLVFGSTLKSLLTLAITVEYSETSLNRPALGPKNMASLEARVVDFVRLPLQRIVWRGRKTLSGIQGELVF
jgi:hypothetical protein